jgi:hypothetical protein
MLTLVEPSPDIAGFRDAPREDLTPLLPFVFREEK